MEKLVLVFIAVFLVVFVPELRLLFVAVFVCVFTFPLTLLFIFVLTLVSILIVHVAIAISISP